MFCLVFGKPSKIQDQSVEPLVVSLGHEIKERTVGRLSFANCLSLISFHKYPATYLHVNNVFCFLASSTKNADTRRQRWKWRAILQVLIPAPNKRYGIPLQFLTLP